jgi:ribosomal protein S18 acetylase RimI-like enzyme
VRTDVCATVKIRPYQESDEEAVIALWRECGMLRWSDPRRDIARKMAVNPEWFLVGESGGRVVATCMVGYEGHRGWINFLAVKPGLQGSGHGRALMSEAERILRGVGCAKINLQVRATNKKVIKFYRKLGFGTEDLINMGKRLATDEVPGAAPEPRRWWGFTAAELRWWVPLVALLVLGFGLRVAYYDRDYVHPDEPITTEVVGHMRQSGDLDTNWAKTPTLTVDLHYDQYNFSSHLYATYWFYRFTKLVPGTLGWRSEREGFLVYRFFSVLLATLAVWQAMRLAERLGGRGAALGAGWLTGVAVQLVQDAHYARPEAFVTALTLAVAAWCWPREKLRVAAVAAGAVTVGVLVACKVSMLLIGWMPLVPVIAAWRGATRNQRTAALASVPLGVVAGFVAGVPGAVANPAAYVNGIEFLMNQYAGLHPPHSRLQGGPVAPLMAGYFVATLGWPVILCALGGAGVLAWRRRWAELVLVAGPVGLFVGYFATRTVFFERNLSHVLPLLLVLAAVGAMAGVEALGRRVRGSVWVVAPVVFGVLAVVSWRSTRALLIEELSGAGAEQHQAYEAKLKEAHPGIDWKEVLLLNDGPLIELEEKMKEDRCPVLLRVTDFNDEWNGYNLSLLAARFETKVVGDYPGAFAHVPACTLHTYHSPHDRYFLVTGVREH